MTTIAGASRFINQAAAAQFGGSARAPSSVLTGAGAADTVSILEAARNALSVRGIGLSSSARALNRQFLSNTSLVNAMFSLGLGSDATVSGASQQILALRSTLPESRLAGSLRGTALDSEA